MTVPQAHKPPNGSVAVDDRYTGMQVRQRPFHSLSLMALHNKGLIWRARGYATRTVTKKQRSGIWGWHRHARLETQYSPGKNSRPAGGGWHRISDKIIQRYVGILLPVLLLEKHTRGRKGHRNV